MSRTTYCDKDCAEKVFAKAEKIKNKNPDLYRADPYGNVMFKSSHGKNTKMGWDIDHIKPKSRGGSNDIVNLQALNSRVNKQKGGTLVKKSRHS